MAIPVLPETAPFSPSQRAWLNGFLAGVLGLDRGTNGHAPASNGAPFGNGHAPALPAPASEEDYPWHDPALPLDDRLKLAEGRKPERVLMAAMAQLDCGACGYLCETYSEAIARGEESDLTKCSPGGKETARKLKELVATQKANPSANGHVGSNGTVAPAAPSTKTGHDRKNPFHAPLLECRKLTSPQSEKDVRLVAFSLAGERPDLRGRRRPGPDARERPRVGRGHPQGDGARGDELVPAPVA